MKKIEVLVFSTLLVVFFGGTNNKSPSGLEELQKKQFNQELTNGSTDQCSDSIQTIDSDMESLMSKLEGTREQISFLSAKKRFNLKRFRANQNFTGTG